MGITDDDTWQMRKVCEFKFIISQSSWHCLLLIGQIYKILLTIIFSVFGTLFHENRLNMVESISGSKQTTRSECLFEVLPYGHVSNSLR